MQWQNLSSLIISIALLGFGVSGTTIVFLKNKIEKHFNKFIFLTLALFPISMSLGFIIFCKIPFNPFEIGIDNRQIFYLFLYFIVMGIPFIFGASTIGISLTRFPISKTYFSNLTGSGIGAIFFVLISYFLHPFSMLLFITIVAFIITIVFSINLNKKIILFTIVFSIIFIYLFYLAFDKLNLKNISQYKAISYALNLPESEIIEERYSPLGLVQVVQAKGLRSIVGLSFLSKHQVPEQKGIFYDGEGMSAITPFDGDKSSILYLNDIPSSLPHFLLEKKDKALIVGVGGGMGLLKALLHNFKKIIGLELNPNIVSLMKNEFAEYSGNIYSKKQMQIIKKEARGFIRNSNEKYNLIEISMLDTYNAASSGIYSLNETYLYTVESIQDFFQHLDDEGMLAITRWVVNPPRDNLKLLNICISALENLEIKDIGKHLIFIRSIQATTLVVSKKPIKENQINILKEFCKTRLFDICYYDGIKENETNRFIKLDTPIYFLAAKQLLSENKQDFIKDYEFDIKITSDNRPYFYNIFKMKMLKYFQKYGTSKIPFTQWGYFTLVILLIPVLIISFVFIILPLFFIRKKRKNLNGKIILYFGLIGIGFFFIEMPLIQKLILFLSHPTYSLSIIISGLLIFTGIGSYFSDKIFPSKRRIFYASLIIICITIFYLFCLDLILPIFMDQNKIIKICITILFLMPLGFFMGIPFPQGLIRIKKIGSTRVAWAWGINGFFSVISTILATIVAISMGFNFVFLIASVCYLAAGLISLKLE
jgi:spermidine synthase